MASPAEVSPETRRGCHFGHGRGGGDHWRVLRDAARRAVLLEGQEEALGHGYHSNGGGWTTVDARSGTRPRERTGSGENAAQLTPSLLEWSPESGRRGGRRIRRGRATVAGEERRCGRRLQCPPGSIGGLARRSRGRASSWTWRRERRSTVATSTQRGAPAGCSGLRGILRRSEQRETRES